MLILVDTREQRPYDFLSQAGDIETAKATLPLGDYSLEGFTHKVALERKSLPDLVMCLGVERERFAREMLKASALESFAVVIEATWQQLLDGKYRSNLNPASAVASIQAFMSRYRVPFFFTGTRENGEAFVAGYLRQYIRGKRHEYDAIIKAINNGKAKAQRQAS